MKKLAVACFAVLLIAAGVFSRTMFVSMAGEEDQPVRYYKSVRIQEGDSLWTLADRYAGASKMDTGTYVQELKQMNQLKKDTIHAGQYLTIMYIEE